MKNKGDEENGKDLLEDIYDDQAPGHALVSRLQFKPWHHPRKHWVRINQLCKLSRELIRESHFQSKTFTYLTLPGEELIDVQALERNVIDGAEEILDVQAVQGIFDVSYAKDLKLKYIGFNSTGSHEKRAALEFAKSIINDNEKIHSSSRIENELVQSISNRRSKSYKVVKEHAPYNAINLDLCGSIANTNPGASDSYFQALLELLEIQRTHMSEPFLLLIATRTNPSDIKKEALKRITDVYGSNLRDRGFRHIFEELIKEKAEGLLDKIRNGVDVPQDALNRVFGVGIGKWLLHIMKPNIPYWDVTLEDICSYSIGSLEKDNMLSMAFKFKKVNQPMTDHYGLTRSQQKMSEMESEISLATKMLEKSKSLFNVDDLLAANPEIRKKIIGQTGQFLATSGYSQEEYEKWANSNFTTLEDVA